MNEILLSKKDFYKIIKSKDLKKYHDKSLEYQKQHEYGYLENGDLEVKYIYNVGLKSLSINFYKRGTLDFWFLFEDLKKPMVEKLEKIAAKGGIL